MGSREEFEALVREHHPAVLRLCRSLLGHSGEAEDAAQDTFLKAYKALDSFEGRAKAATWLRRIAANTCTDVLRRRARQKQDSLDAIAEKSAPAAEAILAGNDPAMEALERRDFLDWAFAGLPPEYRAILTLRELEGLSYEEIAVEMNCSLDSVKARLRRARAGIAQKLRHFYAPETVTKGREP